MRATRVTGGPTFDPATIVPGRGSPLYGGGCDTWLARPTAEWKTAG